LEAAATTRSTDVSVYRPVAVVFDEDTGMVEAPDSEPVYKGKARIWQQDTGGTVILGEAGISLSSVNISIPFDSPLPKIDDIVIVNRCSSNKAVEGVGYVVTHFDGGGMIGGTLKMSCQSLADSATWKHA
jgi:hypothetical protein